MKKKYEKPTVVIEEFHLSESIATACENQVTFGPDDESEVCGDFGFGGGPFSISMYADGKIEPFYDGGCECYYTAPKNSGYFGKS